MFYVFLVTRINLSCRSGAENFIGQLRSFAGAALQRGERSKCSCGPVLGRYLAANNIPRMLGAPDEKLTSVPKSMVQYLY